MIQAVESTVADRIIRFLEKQAVDFIFGHPGGPALPFYEALRQQGSPRHVLVRHEGAASFMADAYAKVTGKVGVCMSTMGPGAANMTIGVATAKSDFTPIVAITGQLPLTNLGRGYQQETDHTQLFKGITKLSVQLKRPESAMGLFERAYSQAVSGRTGPVHVDAPLEVSSSAISGAYNPPKVIRKEIGSASKATVKAAALLIKKSSTPLILAGGGVILANAADELRRFVEVTDIPVATSYNGRGALPEDHPLCLGRIGEYTPNYARKIASVADLIIAVGYRFTDVSTDGWSRRQDATIIQIDIEPSELSNGHVSELQLKGAPGRTLQSIYNELSKYDYAKEKRKSWTNELENARRDWTAGYASIEDSDAEPIKPQRVMKELREAIGRKAIITSGAGRAKMWAASVLPVYEARTWIHSGGFGPMGYELCAAIACKLAKPDRQVVAIGGDASFQMHCQELATAVEYNAPFLMVILNDLGLGVIRNNQLRRYGATFGTDFTLDVNLSEVAHAFGASGQRIAKASELRGAIRNGINSNVPVVLDVIVDRNEIPTFEP